MPSRDFERRLDMASYILKRTLALIPMLLILSVLVFIIIQLPPGDFLTVYVQRLRESGVLINEEEIMRLTREFALIPME